MDRFGGRKNPETSNHTSGRISGKSRCKKCLISAFCATIPAGGVPGHVPEDCPEHWFFWSSVGEIRQPQVPGSGPAGSPSVRRIRIFPGIVRGVVPEGVRPEPELWKFREAPDSR